LEEVRQSRGKNGSCECLICEPYVPTLLSIVGIYKKALEKVSRHLHSTEATAALQQAEKEVGGE